MVVSVLYPKPLPSITITPPDTFSPPSQPKMLRITPPSESHEGEGSYDLARDSLPEWKQSRYVEEQQSKITRIKEQRIKVIVHRGPKPALQVALNGRPHFLTPKRWEPQPRRNLDLAAPIRRENRPPEMTFRSLVRWTSWLCAAWLWFGVAEYLRNCSPIMRISGYAVLVAQLVLIIPSMVAYASPALVLFLSPLARPACLATQSLIRFMKRARHKLITYRIYAVAIGFFGLGFCLGIMSSPGPTIVGTPAPSRARFHLSK
ncbi:hypothetical protein CcaverHIS631_0703270 [Cutaneotrichosporon cavernicola]|nr:hypothetical protein CcaverHIS631_0703270 [Cutaneotrichosporon cavernicola]BEJ10290.1 hypothetical protein CcaverHIS641_0703250 [Cutaneotrichosporon cavernicola]